MCPGNLSLWIKTPSYNKLLFEREEKSCCWRKKYYTPGGGGGGILWAAWARLVFNFCHFWWFFALTWGRDWPELSCLECVHKRRPCRGRDRCLCRLRFRRGRRSARTRMLLVQVPGLSFKVVDSGNVSILPFLAQCDEFIKLPFHVQDVWLQRANTSQKLFQALLGQARRRTDLPDHKPGVVKWSRTQCLGFLIGMGFFDSKSEKAFKTYLRRETSAFVCHSLHLPLSHFIYLSLSLFLSLSSIAWPVYVKDLRIEEQTWEVREKKLWQSSGELKRRLECSTFHFFVVVGRFFFFAKLGPSLIRPSKSVHWGKKFPSKSWATLWHTLHNFVWYKHLNPSSGLIATTKLFWPFQSLFLFRSAFLSWNGYAHLLNMLHVSLSKTEIHDVHVNDMHYSFQKVSAICQSMHWRWMWIWEEIQ